MAVCLVYAFAYIHGICGCFFFLSFFLSHVNYQNANWFYSISTIMEAGITTICFFFFLLLNTITQSIEITWIRSQNCCLIFNHWRFFSPTSLPHRCISVTQWIFVGFCLNRFDLYDKFNKTVYVAYLMKLIFSVSSVSWNFIANLNSADIKSNMYPIEHKTFSFKKFGF